jgi:hypothetical protein
MPAASEPFNAASTKVPERYRIETFGDHVIRGTQLDNNGYTLQTVTIDFLNRIVTVLPCNDTKGGKVFTFGEFDAGSIEWHYHLLKKAGCNPRAPEALLDKIPAPPAKGPGLSL